MSSPPPFPKTTHVYKRADAIQIEKQADAIQIELDLYRPASSTVDTVVPVLVWIHGGALIMGSRAGVPLHFVRLCQEEGYALVAIDYRLCPPVRLPEIVQDVRDAFRWIAGPEGRAAGLDSTRIGVAGASAGGYLTLMTGFAVTPKPIALVSYYGYGDVDGHWYTHPSEHYRTVLPLYRKEMVRADLREGVVTSPPDEGQTEARRRYYHYLRQNGLWTREVTGLDPADGRAQFDPYCPVRNVTATYPPTLLIHGTADTDVPYDRSVEMAHELARNEVEHELVTIPGAEHGLPDGDRQQVFAAHRRSMTFLREHLAP